MAMVTKKRDRDCEIWTKKIENLDKNLYKNFSYIRIYTIKRISLINFIKSNVQMYLRLNIECFFSSHAYRYIFYSVKNKIKNLPYFLNINTRKEQL